MRELLRGELVKVGDCVVITDESLTLVTRIGIHPQTRVIYRDPVKARSKVPPLRETVVVHDWYLSVPLVNLPARIVSINPLFPNGIITVEFGFQIQPESQFASAASRQVRVNPDQFRMITLTEYESMIFNLYFPENPKPAELPQYEQSKTRKAKRQIEGLKT